MMAGIIRLLRPPVLSYYHEQLSPCAARFVDILMINVTVLTNYCSGLKTTLRGPRGRDVGRW